MMIDRRSLMTMAGTAAALAAAGMPNPANAAPMRRAGVRGGHVTAKDGTALFVRDWGEGRPILFLHSWALNSRMWQYQMLPLADAGYRCIAFDRRGHGRSDDPGRGYDFDTLADDVAAVIEARGLKDVVLVGHSFSAGEMVRYVTRHGAARIAKLMIVSPACTPFLLRTADNPTGIDGAFFDQLRQRMMRDFPKWVDDNADPFVVPETSPGMRDWIKGMFHECSLHAAIRCNRLMTTTDFRGELPRIDRPTLVLHGDRDASAPLALTGRPTAAMIPGARLTVYEGAPHGLFATHIERLTRDIRAFARG